jgi:hypothetical protein
VPSACCGLSAQSDSHRPQLTSLITFIAPHTAVQVIVAAMFAFVLLLVAVQVKPFRDKPCNQLLALSQMNICACPRKVSLRAAQH